MTNQGTAPVYYLPIKQTVYQKCLVDIMIQVHKPHIIEYLKKCKQLKMDESNKGEEDVIEDEKDGEMMTDESMFEAFIFNVKQICNHPTLLVDHYIPRNLLLLNSKENIISLSNKYNQVSEILDKLVERDVRKTIIISVSNAKEMDLIESFLLGKRGLQYYRFSGSSLFYENHGSFDFHKHSKSSNSEFDKISISSSSASPPTNIEPSKKKKTSRSKKNVGNSSSNGNGNHSNNDHSSTGNNTSNDNDDSKRKKKKTGRPSNMEKRTRELVGGSFDNNSGNDLQNSGNHKSRDSREEYIPKLSKNNPEFLNLALEKQNKKLNVYLILSSQLKYLLQFEDLKSDLMLSLDSNFTDFEDLSGILDYKMPILKPVIVESLEHYEWEMNTDKKYMIHEINQSSRRQQRKVPDNVSKQNQSSLEKMQFNRLLTLLSIAAFPEVEVESQSNTSPISENLIDWLVDSSKYSFPYSQTIKTKLPYICDNQLMENIVKTLEAPSEFNISLGIENNIKYNFFNSKLNQVEDDKSHDNKRIKYNPINENIPARFNYSLYQSHLTGLIYDTLKAMQSWLTKTEKQLEYVHLDETERQFVIDKGNFECGEIFKKNRDLGVKIEARNKIREKSINEYNKLKAIKEELQDRFEDYNKLEKEEIQVKSVSQDEEINRLKKKLAELNIEINKIDDESSNIRQIYQEKSSQAAEFAAILKMLEKDGQKYEHESKGIFKEIQIKSILEKQQFVEKRTNGIKHSCDLWKGYLDILKVEVDKKSVTAGSRNSRSGRNNTPH